MSLKIYRLIRIQICESGPDAYRAMLGPVAPDQIVIKMFWCEGCEGGRVESGRDQGEPPLICISSSEPLRHSTETDTAL